jgi:predicted kinase
MNTQAVHLVCGSTGAGKTTYSVRLTDELGGIRFSLDDWMATLFWMDIPTSDEPAWVFERIDRCQEQIWTMVKGLAARGIPSVLDFGFVRQQDRAAVAKRAASDSLSIKLHFLDTSATTRWNRVQVRNATQGQTFKFVIARERFDYTESIWQPPTDTELAELNGVRIA